MVPKDNNTVCINLHGVESSIEFVVDERGCSLRHPQLIHINHDFIEPHLFFKKLAFHGYDFTVPLRDSRPMEKVMKVSDCIRRKVFHS